MWPNRPDPQSLCLLCTQLHSKTATTGSPRRSQESVTIFVSITGCLQSVQYDSMGPVWWTSHHQGLHVLAQDPRAQPFGDEPPGTSGGDPGVHPESFSTSGIFRVLGARLDGPKHFTQAKASSMGGRWSESSVTKRPSRRPRPLGSPE